eukprot:1109247-Rhodomonas_salina.1
MGVAGGGQLGGRPQDAGARRAVQRRVGASTDRRDNDEDEDDDDAKMIAKLSHNDNLSSMICELPAEMCHPDSTFDIDRDAVLFLPENSVVPRFQTQSSVTSKTYDLWSNLSRRSRVYAYQAVTETGGHVHAGQRVRCVQGCPALRTRGSEAVEARWPAPSLRPTAYASGWMSLSRPEPPEASGSSDKWSRVKRLYFLR